MIIRARYILNRMEKNDQCFFHGDIFSEFQRQAC